MGRPRKLQKEIAEVLQTRVFIAKTTQVISQTDIAEGFDIGIRTLRRYSSEEERAETHTRSAEQYQRLKEIDTTICAYCKRKTETHARCEDCTILIHPLNTDRNGGSLDMERCRSCMRAILRERVAYEY